MERKADVNPASDQSEVSYREVPVKRTEHAESVLTRLIEQQGAKLSSDYFLIAALAAMATSLACELTHKPRLSQFIGMWPGPLLVMGLYNKLLKVLGTR